MKMEVPQVDLPLEVLAWTKVTEDILNIYKQSCRLQACIFAICTEDTYYEKESDPYVFAAGDIAQQLLCKQNYL